MYIWYIHVYEWFILCASEQKYITDRRFINKVIIFYYYNQ